MTRKASPKGKRRTDAPAQDESGATARSAAPRRARTGGDEPARKLPFPFNVKDLPEQVLAQAMTSGDYPYDDKMKRKRYDRELKALQIELLKLQSWFKETGDRLVVLFEGRDGAGKGGNIARFMQHLNPRTARVVALSKPSEVEAGQWYFQRYAAHMPTRGEIVFFDRSWYNRAGVERVMGFTEEAAVERFLGEAPVFERMLVEEGVKVVKVFLTIGREMQLKRLHARYHDPLKQWKLSPIDYEAPARWDEYSQALERMLQLTDTPHAPWMIVRANCKLRARLETMRHVLSTLTYAGHDDDAVGTVDHKIVLTAREYLAKGGEE